MDRRQFSDVAAKSDGINSAVHRKCLQETTGKVTNIINHLMQMKIVSVQLPDFVCSFPLKYGIKCVGLMLGFIRKQTY